MSVNASVDAGVLAQFLLVQSVVASLPDATVVPFVVQGLSDIPGVKSVRFSSMVKGGQEKALRYPLVSGPSRFGELILDVQEPEVFAPYADHIRNFVFMVGLILEERRQKRVIESHKHYLEQQVAERTNELAQQRDTAQRYLDVAGVMLMALDGNGRIVMINRKGAQLLGKPESALLGADWFDNFVLADERTMVRGVFDTLMSGETQLVERYENRIINAAGLERNMVWNNTLLRNDEGAVIGILSSAEDVTERRLAENALRESEENLAITLHSIGDAVIATQPDGRVTRMNPNAERLSGWKLAEAIGRPLSDVFRIINSDTRETVADPVQLVMRHGAVVGLANHTVLVARDGREYQIADSAAPIRNAAGELVGVVLVFSDITEKYRIEEELRASEERHRLLADNASDVIWTMNLEGRLTYVSPSIEKLRGYTSTEAMGQSLGLMLTPESAARAIDGLEKTRAALDAGLPIPEFRRELEQTCKDGTTVWTEVTASGMHDAAGKFAGILGVTRDITERKRIELKLLESEATFRKLFEDSSDAILLIDGTGVFVECNQAALKLLKMTREQFLLSPLSSISPEFQPDGRRSAESAPEMIALAYSQGLHRFDWTCVNAEGGEFIVEVSLMPIAIKGQTMLHTAWRDITERKAFADRIEHLAFYDPLTDLPNRRLMRDRLEQAITSSARHNRHGALMLLDMDDFKTLNDTQGHDVGDQLLMEVARRLHASVREGDTVARHGGDEFVVILEDLNDDTLAATQAESVAVKILRAVSRAYLLDLSRQGGITNTHTYHCTSSVGITLFQGNSITVDELMKRADTAMYQAKAAGRGTLRFFDPEMQAEVTNRAALDNDLREALQAGQFRLYYQPQVDSVGKWTGAEALVRWQHPQRGMVSPAEFIPQAEATGLIIPLGHLVLEIACAQLVVWATLPDMSHLTVAVNVSARQFRLVDFVDQVLAIVDSTGADPGKLKLELTESLLLEDVEDIIVKMNALKAKGIGFSLDDFGTGYSSLSYLKRLPLDQLKIDQSFVRDVLTDPNAAAIAQTIVALAQSMDLAAIAEGVETEAQHEFLAANGCTAYQGYLFGRPMPIEVFSQRSRAPARKE